MTTPLVMVGMPEFFLPAFREWLESTGNHLYLTPARIEDTYPLYGIGLGRERGK